MTTTTATRYEAIPFAPTRERAEIVSGIMRNLARFETVFSDYARGCDESCGACDACRRVLAVIAQILCRPDSRSWEVWSDDALVGVLYLTKIVPGRDAQAHYAFFDGRLADKTEMIEGMLQWAFEDHEDWRALQRVTVEIPDYAFALAKHAAKFLGFGGDFEYRNDKEQRLPVEGVRRNAIEWRGDMRDVLIMGRLNERPEVEPVRSLDELDALLS